VDEEVGGGTGRGVGVSFFLGGRVETVNDDDIAAASSSSSSSSSSSRRVRLRRTLPSTSVSSKSHFGSGFPSLFG
jgi:hypothetical protein